MGVDTAGRLRTLVGRLSRHLNASSTTEDLTPTQASVLGVVARWGPLTLAELIQREGLNPTMVSRIIGHLAERRLVHRRSDPSDLRSAVLEATPLGQSVHARIRAQRDRVVSIHLARLSPHDRRAIDEALPALEALVVAFAAADS